MNVCVTVGVPVMDGEIVLDAVLLDVIVLVIVRLAVCEGVPVFVCVRVEEGVCD